jgi:hypothetical protein
MPNVVASRFSAARAAVGGRCSRGGDESSARAPAGERRTPRTRIPPQTRVDVQLTQGSAEQRTCPSRERLFSVESYESAGHMAASIECLRGGAPAQYLAPLHSASDSTFGSRGVKHAHPKKVRSLRPLPVPWLARVPSLTASVLLWGCSTTTHPEYHPESSYKYVQNVFYAQNVVVPSERPKIAPVDLEMAAPYLDLWKQNSRTVPLEKSAPARDTPRGKVSSPGGIVIYGDVYGDVFLDR